MSDSDRHVITPDDEDAALSPDPPTPPGAPCFEDLDIPTAEPGDEEQRPPDGLEESGAMEPPD